MKYLFVIILSVLSLAGGVTLMTEPEQQREVPVIYWATDMSPARVAQVALFHEWLIDQGHVDDRGRPVVELRLDAISTGNNSKKIIQSVAGVAADIMDCSIGEMEPLGVLEDVTDRARVMGFSPEATYPALRSALVRDGRQYGFPCNVSLLGFWVNRGLFERLGVETPSRAWTYADFERIGTAFISAANAPGERQTVYFVDTPTGYRAYAMLLQMIRSRGLSIFNETMTRCTLDDPRYAEELLRLRRWVYDLDLMPSAAEEASMAAESGFSGASVSMFYAGRYGMIYNGRWSLIRLRLYEQPMDLSLSYMPVFPGGFSNDLIGTRSAAIYRGSRHKDLAALFLAFLASESYNQRIVDDADALPPNPSFTDTEAYRRPSAYPNEWGTHEAWSHSARYRAIGNDESPFVSRITVMRLMNIAREQVLSDPQILPAEEAARRAAEAINEEIERSIEQSEALRERYGSLIERQSEIDASKAAGDPVPDDWITNPFHKAYRAGYETVAADQSGGG
ncbi:MAG: extracellular solute-binding protein [Phycisphaeraceae bacterium]